ncbi:hypothetical protein CBQ26_15055 [Deinococcus indicus]|uniref:Integrase catalytic domain-containing protein n=1 Tax=Deinococcus indicus TaxID=223556 RepID=A0A246BHA2_9DEIO|nr:hypothetical protein CBQ26_15055 [Deinococcus indicus]
MSSPCLLGLRAGRCSLACGNSCSRLREECLNLKVFYSVVHAQVILESWRTFYNNGRPHLSLGYRTPGEWAREAGGRPAVPMCGQDTAHAAVIPATR